MSNSQKRGFRLPWGTDRADDEAAPDQAGAGTATATADSDDLGEGPFRVTSAPPANPPDAAPATSDPAVGDEAVMIEMDAQTTQAAAADDTAAEPTPTEPEAQAPTAADPGSPAEPGADAAAGDASWPTVDRASSPQHEGDAAKPPPIRVAPESRVPRRDNPLVAGLVKAMREAAVASRAETTARLQEEATARVEAIRENSTAEGEELKKRADEDMAAIRDWSKAEMTRIREETEARTEARKAELEEETERHSARVEQLVDEVQSTVTAYEAEMDEFFEALLAEDDPARLATLAERAPEPPDLSGEPPAAIGDPEPVNAALEDHEAAEAEAAATEGLEPSAGDPWQPAAADGAEAQGADGPGTDDAGQTRLLVTGLTSVAGISAFKGALGQVAGVESVSVSSGERGVFVFAVQHGDGLDLASAIAGLPGFSARVTDATDAGVSVVAHEPAA